MAFGNENKIDRVWKNILKYEGETFYTVTNIEYTYVAKHSFVPRRRVEAYSRRKTMIK